MSVGSDLRARTLWLSVLVLLGLSGAGGVAASPLPSAVGVGPQNSLVPPTNYNPGDNHGAIGRTYTVFKVNDEFLFVNRSSQALTPSSDVSFWSKYVNRGGGTFVSFTDGRVMYDPYAPSACSANGGHWIATEIADVQLLRRNATGGPSLRSLCRRRSDGSLVCLV